MKNKFAGPKSRAAWLLAVFTVVLVFAACETTEVEQYQYLVTFPQDFDNSESWPVIVFLHGTEERGDNITLVRSNNIVNSLAESDPSFRFVVVSPQVPLNQFWDPVRVKDVVDEVIDIEGVDRDRIYLTGLSMGGFGTFRTAIDYPNVFAALGPMSGGGNPARVYAIKDVPTWVFHNAVDPAVPFEESNRMVNALRKIGADVRFTIVPRVGHNAWVDAYNDPAFYDWLLEQRR